MNTKKILAVAAVAVLAIGIGAAGQSASAQQQKRNSDWDNSIGSAVTDAVLAQVQQEVADVTARIAAVTGGSDRAESGREDSGEIGGGAGQDRSGSGTRINRAGSGCNATSADHFEWRRFFGHG